MDGKGWHVEFNGNDGYEIKKGRQKFKVKVDGISCSCRSWDLIDIPCPHECCAIFDKGMNLKEFIHEFYFKDVYKRIYGHTIQPLYIKDSWPTNSEEILALVQKKNDW